ncbi:hypothetical protein Dimus_006163, partial [Dionaea muscipula]
MTVHARQGETSKDEAALLRPRVTHNHVNFMQPPRRKDDDAPLLPRFWRPSWRMTGIKSWPVGCGLHATMYSHARAIGQSSNCSATASGHEAAGRPMADLEDTD